MMADAATDNQDGREPVKMSEEGDEVVGDVDKEGIADGSPLDPPEKVDAPPEEEEEDVSPKRSKKTHNSPCSKCQKRQSRRGCSQMACFTCCTDHANCPGHKEARDKVLWKQQVLEGTTLVNRLAQELRQRKLANKRFREPGFAYTGDTVLIWSLKEFGKHTSWKEEAIRKSERRRRYQRPHATAASPPPPAAAAAAATISSKSATSYASNGVESQQDERISKKKRKFYQIMDMLHQQASS